MAKSPRSKERQKGKETSSADRLEHRLDRDAGTMLNVLDNPDDGELFSTGDASDFAGENSGESRKKRGKNRR